MIPQLTENAKRIHCKFYAQPLFGCDPCPYCDINGKTVPHETPEDTFVRISGENPDFYKMLCRLDFLPNSPTIFNLGVEGRGTLSACFKFNVQDSLESIMAVATKSAFVLKFGGGTGFYLDVRPKGAPIRSTHGKACGPISILRTYQKVAEMITQGGKRAGAQMAILSCDHKDVKEFINCKNTDPEVFNTFNISVAITDDFMEKATSSVEGFRTPQQDLLEMMAKNAWKTGDPGVYFVDRAERDNPTPHLGRLSGTNPCGEVPMLDNESCNLGSLNLRNFVLGGEVNWNRLGDTVRTAVQYLDFVIENNAFPDPEILAATQRTRKIGLGVMGFADMLALLGIQYDSEDALTLAKELGTFIYKAADFESRRMAEQDGPYPAWRPSPMKPPGSGRPDPDPPKRRHATLMSIAPTGTIALLAGCSPSIEPHFSLKWTNMMGDGGQLQERISILDELDGFVPQTAHDIDPKAHIAMQAAWQEQIDLAVSKTVNMPHDATWESIRDTYILMWKSGCKGGTVYRDGSHLDQPLVSKVDESSNASIKVWRDLPIPNGRERLPARREGFTHKFEVGGTEGYVTVNHYPDGRPGEMFIKVSKGGSQIDGLLDFSAILISMLFQYNVPIDVLISKFKGVRFEPSGRTDHPLIPMVTSIPDFLFRLLEMEFGDEDAKQKVITDSGMFCEECNGPATYDAGCLHCARGCGWSRCG